MCVSTRELHSVGVRRLEIRWIERGGEMVGIGRVWRIGGNGNINVVDILKGRTREKTSVRRS